MPKIKKKNNVDTLHFTSIFSMSLVLLLVGLTTLLIFTALDLSLYVRENINFSVQLSDDVPEIYRQRIEKYLDNAGFAKSIRYISKEEALKSHAEEMGTDPEKFLGYNPLKASLEVKPNANYANTDSLKMIERKLKSFEYIYRIDYQEDVVDFVSKNVRKLSMVLLGITLLLLIISVALINNTVRLAVYSNRFIINTMKLVGATNGFIRKPYLLQALRNGVIAAALALAMLALTIIYVLQQFGLTSMSINPLTAAYVCAAVFVSGILFTLIASYFAVGRYLKMDSNDIYLV
jgi:cell division transport system permease protein